MNQQLQAWSGEFGADYTKRNRVHWQDRVPFWQYVMQLTVADSVLEVGCNAGWNLQAIRSLDKTGRRMVGVDINQQALIEAQQALLDVRACPAQELATVFEPQSFDLVFTAGVLIHVAPADLIGVMKGIVRTARHHVLCVEYESNIEEEVNYHGHDGLLWKRPFGALYEAMGLTIIDQGEAEGFDRCQYTLLGKT